MSAPTFKWLRSREKESSESTARGLLEPGDPYTEDMLADLVKAAVRGEEIKVLKQGRSAELVEPRNWYRRRVLPSTVVINREEYICALAQGFRLAIFRAGVVVDFDRARRRDFGQRWSDYTRGELGELGIKKFLREKYGKNVRLEKRIDARPEEFYSRDISRVEERGRLREPNIKVSIKATKLGGEWLDLPGAQVERSEAFALAKAGLSLDHLAAFLKERRVLEWLFQYAKERGEPGFEVSEIQRILDAVPPLMEILVYIPGFVWKKEFRQQNFSFKQRRRGREIYQVIEKGIGSLSAVDGNFEVRGITGMSGDHHIASGGFLRWREGDWKTLTGGL